MGIQERYFWPQYDALQKKQDVSMPDFYKAPFFV